jgi:hypothetical protein
MLTAAGLFLAVWPAASRAACKSAACPAYSFFNLLPLDESEAPSWNTLTDAVAAGPSPAAGPDSPYLPAVWAVVTTLDDPVNVFSDSVIAVRLRVEMVLASTVSSPATSLPAGSEIRASVAISEAAQGNEGNELVTDARDECRWPAPANNQVFLPKRDAQLVVR